MSEKITIEMVRDPKCSPEILHQVLKNTIKYATYDMEYYNYSVRCYAANNSNCFSETLKMVLERDENDLISCYAAKNPNCPAELLKMVLERGKNDLVSYWAAQNSNYPKELLVKILERNKNDLVSLSASKNRNCPPQVRIKWLIATGQIKMPDLSKHDVQVIKDYNKPDEEWEQFKRMVEDE